MRAWTQGFVEVAGGRLSYHRTGGAGPPLVLSHGLTDNGLCWTRLARALEDDFDLILLDARGHGDSAAPVGPAFDPADDIAAAITHLSLNAPVVMGHSVGARATAAFANAHPGVAAKVILEDPPLMPPVEPSRLEARRRAFAEQVARYGTLSDADLLDLGRTNHPSWPKAEFEAWTAAKRQVDPEAFPVFARPWQADIDRIAAPTLLIHGDAALGSLVSQAAAAEAVAINSNVRAVRIEGAGHNVRRENFPAYLAAVRAFLDD